VLKFGKLQTGFVNGNVFLPKQDARNLRSSYLNLYLVAVADAVTPISFMYTERENAFFLKTSFMGTLKSEVLP
jgi:hypothetical protein